MSLDNIQLSSQTCAILFNGDLIEEPAFNSKVNSEEKIEIQSLGENKSHILFIINNSSHKFLPDEEMELLTKLVSACKLTMADIALVNFSSNQYSYRHFNDQFKPKKILVFGVRNRELDLPFDIPYFQVQSFQQQLFLTAPPLKEFLNNTNLKKELWKTLQKLFL